MKLIPILAAAGIMFAATHAQSALVTVDFEGASSFSSVNNFYNGGTDGAGASGVNYGIAFSSPAQGLINDGLGAAAPDGRYFSNQPAGTTVMFAPDSPAVMSVASAFAGAVSFYYSSKTNPFGSSSGTAVTVYDGLGATGSVVGSAILNPNANADAAWDTWSLASIVLTGVGKSISFGDNGGYIAYDNITVNAVPLPAALLLFPFGAAAMGLVGRRKRAR